MPSPAHNFFSYLRVLVMGLVVSFALESRAEVVQGGFSATLSADQKNAIGLASLAPNEQAALDQLVKTDVAQARNEGSTELDGGFVARHSAEELHRAGLDRLTPEQLKKLDALIAGALAAAPKPKERPRLRDSDVLNPQTTKPQVHGEVSLTYGHVSGVGDFKGGSLWVDVFDPKTGLSLGVGISQFNGPGFYRYGSGYGNAPGYWDFGPGYGYDDFGYYDASIRRTTTAGMIGVGNRFFEASYGWERTPAFYRDFRRN